MLEIFKYPIKLKKDSNGTFLVTFPDFPDAVTFGEDEDDAIFHAENALDEIVHSYMHHKQLIPPPSQKGKYFVYVRPSVVAKILLYREMQNGHIKKAELARRLDCNKKQVDRLMDTSHNSTLSQLTAAYAAIGKRMIIGIENIT